MPKPAESSETQKSQVLAPHGIFGKLPSLFLLTGSPGLQRRHPGMLNLIPRDAGLVSLLGMLDLTRGDAALVSRLRMLDLPPGDAGGGGFTPALVSPCPPWS